MVRQVRQQLRCDVTVVVLYLPEDVDPPAYSVWDPEGNDTENTIWDLPPELHPEFNCAEGLTTVIDVVWAMVLNNPRNLPGSHRFWGAAMSRSAGKNHPWWVIPMDLLWLDYLMGEVYSP